MTNLFCLLTLLLSATINPPKNQLTVEITNPKHKNGKMMIQVLDLNQKAIQSAVIDCVLPKTSWVSADLLAGKYVVKVFHDENNNGKMDTKMFGIPKEGWGTSNNVKAQFGPPDFEKMIFDLQTSKKIQIELNY